MEEDSFGIHGGPFRLLEILSRGERERRNLIFLFFAFGLLVSICRGYRNIRLMVIIFVEKSRRLAKEEKKVLGKTKVNCAIVVYPRS